ncbi:protein YtgA [Shigella sonnei]|uniref:Protein YtgA n=7 Tax=Escherichia TaxID=561 RepID=YTGA_ECOLI|nr:MULTISPECIES: protein YtgA [Gammaproteobacteria]YP_010051214.1 protein YtgA [Escherichia coli str. K-12 substr. MG1655]P0DSH8.1 RecName: Full=Protein YtgA [Escherichia coli K-12]MBU5561591.1 protein YtgA [Escherichia sp. S69_ASV_4]MBU5647720.1 protein YtgA [Pluralibacter sp. S54_ASV_43]MCC2206328.1 protein YtgA [Shigella sp. CLA-AA-H239]MCQ8840005.1 protein YtgA [Klebsiella sp. KJ_S1]MDG2887259.1 protein YtgA [Vibrio parahaemolyticus]USJ84410.1 protein YtgA [Shigella sp. PIB]
MSIIILATISTTQENK